MVLQCSFFICQIKSQVTNYELLAMSRCLLGVTFRTCASPLSIHIYLNNLPSIYIGIIDFGSQISEYHAFLPLTLERHDNGLPLGTTIHNFVSPLATRFVGDTGIIENCCPQMFCDYLEYCFIELRQQEIHPNA